MVTLLGLRETDTVQLENERVRETLEILWRKAERQVDNTVSKDELNVLTLSILRYLRYINRPKHQ